MPSAQHRAAHHGGPRAEVRGPVLPRGAVEPGLCRHMPGRPAKAWDILVKFNGINIGHVAQSLEFSKWSNRVKTIFHKDYLKNGGQKDMKKWAVTRWVKKKPVIPGLQ